MPRPSAVFALTIALILVIAASLAVAVLTIRWGTSEGPATGQIVTLSGVPLASSPTRRVTLTYLSWALG